MDCNVTEEEFSLPLGARGIKNEVQGYVRASQGDISQICILPSSRKRGIAGRILAWIGRGSVYMTQKRYWDFKYTR